MTNYVYSVTYTHSNNNNWHNHLHQLEGVVNVISARNEPTFLILDDIEIKWAWKESELLHFREMWNDGVPINDLAKELKTNRRSVALLVMDQEMKGEIGQRKFGLWGN